MKTYSQLVEECLPLIKEVLPWDLEERLAQNIKPPILLDVRETDEFNAMHIRNSINVPRGILEGACDYGYEETVPALAAARDEEVVVICRSGRRSALAALVMQHMGYTQVSSLKTGIRGWFEYDQPMVDQNNKAVDEDAAEDFFTPRVAPEQMPPAN